MSEDEDQVRQASDALTKLFEAAADSSAIPFEEKYGLLETLNDIQKIAGAVYDLIEQDKAFHPATVNALHKIESECENIRFRLAGHIIKQNPGALHMMMHMNKRRQERNASGT